MFLVWPDFHLEDLLGIIADFVNGFQVALRDNEREKAIAAQKIERERKREEAKRAREAAKREREVWRCYLLLLPSFHSYPS